MTAKNATALLTVLAGVAISTSPAAFAAATWNFSNTTTGTPDGCQVQNSGFGQQATNSGTFGNSFKCAATTGTGPTLTVTGWGGQNSTGSTGFQTAYVSKQGSSGFGLASQYEGISIKAPNHSMDNDPTASVAPDLFLLNFSSAVALDQIVLGWSQSDADFTLMAYTGSQAPTSFLQGKDQNNLTAGGAAAGWTLIENSGDTDTSSTGYGGSGTDIYRSVNTANTPVISSWWLISAYSAGYGGGTFDSLKDYMKVLSVSTKDVTFQATVPEPGSMALIGAALASMVALRRRGSSKQV